MSNQPGASLLAVSLARGGSKGLPGKNIRSLAGLPLIAHSVLFAKMCPAIERHIVSTDSSTIAEVARSFGADVPFMRPAELAQDDTPAWAAIRHALLTVEDLSGRRYDYLLLLDPTFPARLPEDIAGAFRRLLDNPEADGIMGVSRPVFDPISHAVVERDGWMTELVEGGAQYTRRQDVPPVYHVNGTLYIWTTDFVKTEETNWRRGRLLMYEIPEYRIISTDDIHHFERADVLVRSGFIKFPWLVKEDA